MKAIYTESVMLEAQNAKIIDNELNKYVDKVYSFLKSMQPGTAITIKNHVKTVTMKLYIEVTKMFMQDLPFQGGIEFNADYSVIKKHDVNWLNNDINRLNNK